MIKPLKIGFYSAIISGVFCSYAHAGFQFTAPIQPVEQPVIATTPDDGLLPMLGQEPAMPAVPKAEVKEEQPTPIVPKAAPMVDIAEPQTSMNYAQGQYDLAVGFGKNLPLVSALGQVIPSDYTYVIDKDVAIGKTVSWNGGQEWPKVVDAMLNPLGLRAIINEKTVRIFDQSKHTHAAPLGPIVEKEVTPAPTPPVSIIPKTMPDEQSFDAKDQKDKVTSFDNPVIEPKVITTADPIPDPRLDVTSVKIDQDEQMKSEIPDVSEGQWTALSGQSLKTVLEAWSDLAEVDLFWSSDYDFPLLGDVNVSGNFEQATETLLAGFSQAQPKPIGRLHPNLPHGPAVLIIETKQTIE